MFCYDGLPHWLRIATFVLAIGATWVLVAHYRKPIDAGRTLLKRIAMQPALAMLTIFLLSMLVNAALSTIVAPYPRVHDEYAYQLAADTYAHGRLTNETHLHWKHFETFHILSRPSYMAKYPPGNGLLLAVGQYGFGNSLVGTWLGLSIGFAALFWMLTALLPNRWALLGCLLLTIKASVLMAWGQTWWSGSVQMLGGALLFGGTLRIVARDRNLQAIMVNATIAAMGAAILSISRPFEGLFSCLICAGIIARWIWQDVLHPPSEPEDGQSSSISKLLALIVPFVVIGTGAFAFHAINNKAVTDSFTTLPYREHSRQYSATPLSIWQPVQEIRDYNLPRMKELYVDWSRARHAEAQTPSGFANLAIAKVNLLFRFFPLAGGLCLLTVPFMMGGRRRWLWMAAASVGAMILIQLQLVNSLTFPHYVAPLAGLFYLLLFHGLRCWKLAGRKLNFARWIPTLLVLYTLFNLIALFIWMPNTVGQPRRFAIQAELELSDGKDLVFVDYQPDHNVHEEWVYNRADIDGADIVWANLLTSTENHALVDYYPARNVWICQVGRGKVRLIPWGDSQQPHSAQSADSTN